MGDAASLTTTSTSSPSNPAGTTGVVCQWVHDLSIHDVPKEILERTKHLILDGLGCAFVASHLSWSELAVKTMLEFEGTGDCTLIGWNKKLGPLAAALLNSSFIQGFEIDDWHSAAPCHSESIVLPAVFAGAEQGHANNIPCTGADALLAIVVGFEIGPRCGLALHGGDLLGRGWHSGTVMGHAGSAAAVAKLFRLPPRQIEHTFGTSMTQACGLMSAQFGSMAKRMQHGFAARNGLFAAMMSRGGYTGIESVFEIPYGGFLSAFGDGTTLTPKTLPSELTDGLGSRWEIERIRVKVFCSQAGNHAMIHCINELQATYPNRFKDLSQIANLHIEMGDVLYKHGCFPCPPPPLSVTAAQMCTAYAAAVALVDGDVFTQSFSRKMLDRPELWDLMTFITYEHNTDFDIRKPGQEFRMTTRVTVTFKDGERVMSELEAPKTILPGLTNEDIRTKWRKMTNGTMDPHRRDEIERMILSLETLDDLTKLTSLLGPSVSSPID